MPNGWNGPDPTVAVDADDYELGVEYLANVDLTISSIRVWADASSVVLSGRRGRVWSSSGTLLGSAALPDTLPVGWSTHPLDAPVGRTAGSRFVVSYSTGGNYGALVGGMNTNTDSVDGAVTALAFSNATDGTNGRFDGTPGNFPVNGANSHAFYGIDVEYLSSTNPPSIDAIDVTINNADVTVVITASDPDSIAGATYRIEWGDDTVSSSTSALAAHTYSISGVYPLLVTVTDTSGLFDYAARAVKIVVPPVFDFDRPVIASAQNILNTIIQVFMDHNVELPDRKVITVSTVAVDSPVLAVMYGGVAVGPPGNELNTPFRGDSPRTMTFNVELWRETPAFGPGGAEPASDVVTDSAIAAMQDSWLLLEAAYASDEAMVGVVANVTTVEPQGERVGVSMSIELQVP